MNSIAPTKPKSFTSRIPVSVKRVCPSKLISQQKETSKKTPLLQTSSKMCFNRSKPTQKKVVNISKPQKMKPFAKTYEQNKTSDELPAISQASTKISAKNSHDVKIKPTEKCSSQANRILPFRTDTNKVCEKRCTNKSAAQSSNKTYLKNSQQPLKVNILSDKNSKHADYNLSSLQTALPIDVNISANSEEVKNDKSLSSEVVSEKENQETDFCAQEGIKFEANEIFRKMILSNRGLSPSICRLTSGHKLSSAGPRPSAYQKFELHPDPFRQAMEAIANVSAKRASKKYSVTLERKIQSPYKERTSLYVPGATPSEVVMKSLEALKARKMLKETIKSSKKKVTFNFNVEEYTANVDLYSELTESKSSECRLSQINEGSSPFKPIQECKKTEISELKEDISLLSLSNSSEIDVIKVKNYRKPLSEFQSSIDLGETINQTCNLDRQFCSPVNKKVNLCTIFTKSTFLRECDEVKQLLPVEYGISTFCSSKKAEPVSALPGFVGDNIKLSREIFNSPKTVHESLLKKYISDQNIQRTSRAKIYTPRPISFSSNKRQMNENPSPEFFLDEAPGQYHCAAPICTPLVLKNMSKSCVTSPSTDFSPVRLKLDFTAVEKDTPTKKTSTKKLVTTVPFENILTAKKRLDDLADQECSFFMLNAGNPVVCGRYLTNPIAVTLTEGDEMHFVPIRL